VELVLIILAVLAVLAVVGFVVVRRRSSGVEAPAPPRRPAPPVPAAAPLRERLSRSRRAVGDRLGSLLGRSGFDDEFWSGLEETLIAADVGVTAASRVVEEVRNDNPRDAAEARGALERHLVALFTGKERGLRRHGHPSVILVVGVNGTGKTTSIAKLAAQLQRDGDGVLLAAADTFRAAADEQLRTWADRVGVEIVGGQPGADPASVAYDAYESAKARRLDVVLVDTAGRLQTKANLMDELAKVARVVRRAAGEIDEVLLVLDGTTGQNAISQARSFLDTVGVTGIVLTKLDGTARGGIAVAVEQELGIPVKYIGVGEGVEDLVPFDPEAFVDALLGS
jgi:fused signal recognition particle receptor